VKIDTIDTNHIKKAIRKCYASMWTYRCFSERAAVGMEQKQTAMALLCQPYAVDVVANGVAISLIPFRKDFPGKKSIGGTIGGDLNVVVLSIRSVHQRTIR
jgi:hypothetical protein